ncbi:MAG: TetR/AcrR family transcriptional regulator [Marmoricola sp.]
MSGRRHGAAATARRDALLRACVEVAAERGRAGITHRAVTERAGLPLATVSYFFDSIDALADEALRTFMEAEERTQVDLAEALAGASSTAEEVAAAFVGVAAPRHPETLALLEALLHAARSGEHEAARRALGSARAVAAAAAAAAGAPDPQALAPALTALAHGLALHRLAAQYDVGDATTYDGFRALFLGQLLLAGDVEAAVELARGG